MRDRGYSLVEILIALGIGVLILGLLLTITLANRRLYVLDQSRTASNQNLRAALDLVVTDIRQAGERLPADFPAVVSRVMCKSLCTGGIPLLKHLLQHLLHLREPL